MPLVELNSLADPGVTPYARLTEQQLCKENVGLLIAESPKVIKVALEEGYSPVSLLCERKHIEGDAAEIIAANPELTVYTGSRELLASLTGYTLTRGVLCAMKRPEAINPSAICNNAKRVAVIEAVCDTTNIGSIFRSGAALGIDGVLLTPDSCDPFNRRSIRVSMGAVFKIPWAFCEDPVNMLNKSGFATIALALQKDAFPISHRGLKEHDKVAMVVGTEGNGLSKEIISKCRYKAIIPMHRNVDSLNVGVAAAIAFYALC